MDLNIYNSLILAGIVQGFVFTIVVLFSKKYHSRSTYYLVALIFCFSISNLQYFLPDANLMPIDQMYIWVYLPWASLIPVLIYYYVRYFLFPKRKSTRIEQLLFAPFIIFMVLTVIFKTAKIIGYEDDGFNGFFVNVLNVHELFAIAFTHLILLYLFYRIWKYEKDHRVFNIKKINKNVNWLKITLVVSFLTTILWTYLAIRNIFQPQYFTSFYGLWIVQSIVIYWLGHIGIYKYGVLKTRNKIREFAIKNNSKVDNFTTKNEHIIALEELMLNEKVYLNSNLTLEFISEKLDLSSSYLSRIINAEMNKSFTDYLNELRVKEAQTYLKNPEFTKYTVLAMGLEAGFNSKSAFYNVFKKTTGLTPAQFKNEQLPN